MRIVRSDTASTGDAPGVPTGSTACGTVTSTASVPWKARCARMSTKGGIGRSHHTVSPSASKPPLRSVSASEPQPSAPDSRVSTCSPVAWPAVMLAVIQRRALAAASAGQYCARVSKPMRGMSASSTASMRRASRRLSSSMRPWACSSGPVGTAPGASVAARSRRAASDRRRVTVRCGPSGRLAWRRSRPSSTCSSALPAWRMPAPSRADTDACTRSMNWPGPLAKSTSSPSDTGSNTARSGRKAGNDMASRAGTTGSSARCQDTSLLSGLPAPVPRRVVRRPSSSMDTARLPTMPRPCGRASRATSRSTQSRLATRSCTDTSASDTATRRSRSQRSIGPELGPAGSASTGARPRPRPLRASRRSARRAPDTSISSTASAPCTSASPSRLMRRPAMRSTTPSPTRWIERSARRKVNGVPAPRRKPSQPSQARPIRSRPKGSGGRASPRRPDSPPSGSGVKACTRPVISTGPAARRSASPSTPSTPSTSNASRGRRIRASTARPLRARRTRVRDTGAVAGSASGGRSGGAWSGVVTQASLPLHAGKNNDRRRRRFAEQPTAREACQL